MEITAKNYEDVLGNGLFSFDPAGRTLTISGSYTAAGLNVVKNEACDGLIIRVANDAVLESGSGSALNLWKDTTITGPGALTLRGPGSGLFAYLGAEITMEHITVLSEAPLAGNGSREKLIVHDAAVTARTTSGDRSAVFGFTGGIDLDECRIEKPAGGHADSVGDVTDVRNDKAAVVIIAPGHRLKRIEGVPATCTDGGVRPHYVCEYCGRFYDDAAGIVELLGIELTIGASGHDWGEWTETKAPTETEAGERERACARCGEKQTEPVPALGILYGDADHDGDIDRIDAALVLRRLTGANPLPEETKLRADADRDGFVTAADAAWIITHRTK